MRFYLDCGGANKLTLVDRALVHTQNLVFVLIQLVPELLNFLAWFEERSLL